MIALRADAHERAATGARSGDRAAMLAPVATVAIASAAATKRPNTDPNASPMSRYEANNASPLASTTATTAATVTPVRAGPTTGRTERRHGSSVITRPARVTSIGVSTVATAASHARRRYPAALSRTPAPLRLDNPTATTTSNAITSGTSSQGLDRQASHGANATPAPPTMRRDAAGMSTASAIAATTPIVAIAVAMLST